jgi:hypothetical protein
MIDTVEVVLVTGGGTDSSCHFAAAMIAVAFSLARACHVTLALTAHNIDSFLTASLSKMIFIDSHPFNASAKPFSSTLLTFPVTWPSL